MAVTIASVGPFTLKAPFTLKDTVDLGLAAGALFLLAIVAFRRARGVRSPTARRAAARQAVPAGRAGTRSRRVATAVLSVARAAVGVAALVGIVWLTRELFR